MGTATSIGHVPGDYQVISALIQSKLCILTPTNYWQKGGGEDAAPITISPILSNLAANCGPTG